MISPSITPFANESDVLHLGGLDIENRLDRVSLFGALDITRDAQGLEMALVLKRLLDEAVRILSAEKDRGALPARVETQASGTVPNPFGDKD